MTHIHLESCRKLFVDEESIGIFAEMIDHATEGDDTPLLMYKQKHLATAISPEATEQLLSDRILKRFVENPKFLESFTSRLAGLSEQHIVE